MENVPEFPEDFPLAGPSRGILEDSTIVLFDFETSGFGHDAEICQIAALHEDRKFNVYTVPLEGISYQASKITGLYIAKGEMFLHNQRLDTVPAIVALVQFIDFLRSFERDVLLVAHNGFRFDVPILLRQLLENDLLSDFKSVVIGFSDSLIVSRNHLVERREAKKSFSLEALGRDFLGDAAIDGAHDAGIDVKILQNLIEVIGIDSDSLKNGAKSVTASLKELELSEIRATIKVPLQALKPRVSAGMIDKIARAGITMEMLENAFIAGQDEAIEELLKAEDIGGRPRVTRNARVISELIKQMELICGENQRN